LSSVNNVRATNQGYTFERLAKIPISETIEGSKESSVFLKKQKLDVPLLELTTSYIKPCFVPRFNKYLLKTFNIKLEKTKL